MAEHTQQPGPAPASDFASHICQHRYGKSRVRLLRVERAATHHNLHDWTVEVLLSGDFEEVFTRGDNSQILATDTMKNSVYVLARKSGATSMEVFAGELVHFFLERNPQVSSAEVRIESHLWKRLTVDGSPHPTAFMKGSDERQTTRVVGDRSDSPFRTYSGFTHMTVLKTAQSGFVGFLRDELTTLPESTDRLFGTEVTAEWTYMAEVLPREIEFNRVRHAVRERMVTTFARHDSRSVQHTLHAMAEAALQESALLEEISLRMPNKHNLLVDLARFGLDNPNLLFVPTDEPHGTIEATVRRGARP